MLLLLAYVFSTHLIHGPLARLLASLPSSQKVADTTIAALRWLGAKEHPFIFW